MPASIHTNTNSYWNKIQGFHSRTLEDSSLLRCWALSLSEHFPLSGSCSGSSSPSEMDGLTLGTMALWSLAPSWTSHPTYCLSEKIWFLGNIAANNCTAHIHCRQLLTEDSSPTHDTHWLQLNAHVMDCWTIRPHTIYLWHNAFKQTHKR
jgi:hypothetical protein